jgi:hypothetical protein
MAAIAERPLVQTGKRHKEKSSLKTALCNRNTPVPQKRDTPAGWRHSPHVDIYIFALLDDALDGSSNDVMLNIEKNVILMAE